MKSNTIQKFDVTQRLVLVLTGLIVSVIYAAVANDRLYAADPNTNDPLILFTLFGGLGSAALMYWRWDASSSRRIILVATYAIIGFGAGAGIIGAIYDYQDVRFLGLAPVVIAAGKGLKAFLDFYIKTPMRVTK